MNSRRALALFFVSALSRALCLALATALVNGPGSGIRFTFSWAVLYSLITVTTAAFELPIQSAVQLRPKQRVWFNLLMSLLWSALLVQYVPWLRAVGFAYVASAMSVAGMLTTLLPPPVLNSRPLRAASAAPSAALVLGLVLLDPEASYSARYQENHLQPVDIAQPPPYPGRSPATLTDLEVANAVAHTWMRTHPTETLRWSWEETVVLEGLLQFGEAAGDPAPAAYAKRWITAHLETGMKEPLWADAAAPAMICLRVSSGEEFVRNVAHYLQEQAPRLRSATLSHTGLLLSGLLPPQAWVDSSFMHGVFLNRLHAGGVEWAGQEAEILARGLVQELFDEQAGLFRHAAFELGPVSLSLPVEPMFWLRGNAWLLYFLVDLQMSRTTQGLKPEPAIAQTLGVFSAALLNHQTRDGLWLTDIIGPAGPDNPIETSGSALILAGLLRARAAGLMPELDPQALNLGRHALREHLRWDNGHPTLTQVSTGTMPGFRRYYGRIPMDENVAHGVGALLLALSQPATNLRDNSR